MLFPMTTPSTPGSLAKAQELAAAGRPQDAEAILDVILANHPTDVGALIEKAFCRRRQGDPEGALEAFTQASLAAPDHTGIAMERSRDLRALARWSEADATIDAVLSIDPNHPWALVEKAHAHTRAGHHLKAVETFAAAAAREPNQPAIRLEQARSLRAAGLTREASTLLNQLATRTPNHPAILLEQARELWAAGQPAEAIALLEDAIARAPESIDPLLVRAEYALSADDPTAAWDHADRARRIAPGAIGPYLLGARAHAADTDFDSAFALLEQAAAILGPGPDIAAMRIHLLRQTRHDDQAIRTIVQDARLPSFGLWTEATMFAIAQGEFDRAESAFAAIPAITQAERAQACVLQALAAEGRRDYAAAIAAYKQAIAHVPSAGGWHADLARCHLLLADTENARNSLIESLRHDRSPRRTKGQPERVSQHHIGQLLDEFMLDRDVLARIQAIAPLPPAERAEHLLHVVQQAPDATAPAIMLMLAARQAGHFRRAPSGGSPAIPRTLIQFWDSDPPPDIAALMRTWQELNPDFHYTLFDNHAAEAFLAAHHPEAILQAFRRALEPAQRADLFRLAVLATTGGFYADADDRCLQPLSACLPAQPGLILYQENYGTLANNVIGATPGHKLIQRALDGAAAAIDRGDNDMIWLATGPGLLTRAFASLAAEDPSILCSPDVAVLELWQMQRVAGLHCPARYKRTKRHWSRALFNPAEQGVGNARLVRIVSK
jgi:tetratricopeptide (TPR) repeat protein